MLCSNFSQHEFVDINGGSSPKTYIDLDAPTSTEFSPAASSTEITHSSSGSNVASLNEPLNVTKAQLFNSFIADLEFEHSESAPTASSSNETVEESDGEDEITDIQFPYERENMFEDLIERISCRLNAGELDHPVECDVKLEKVEDELRQEEEQARLEKLERRNFAFKNAFIFTCMFCSRSYSSQGALEDHVKTHNPNGNRFQCPKCKMCYKHKKNLVVHMKNHTAKLEFECSECSFVFRNANSLEAHMQRRHKLNQNGQDLKETEMVQCKICAEAIPEMVYKRHLYYCENKEEILKRRAETKSRSVPPSPAMSVISCKSTVSMGDAPVTSPRVSLVDKSCPVCSLSFASRQSLLRHISRKHKEYANDESVTAVRYVSIESPNHQFVCKDCGKQLTTRSSLTLHQERIHKKILRHECEVCHKAYPIPSELRKHIKRVHNKEKPESPPVIDEESLVDMVF